MDLWLIIKQRYLFLSIFIIMILLSLFLLGAIWKSRSNIPKALAILTIIICAILIILSLFSFILIISFGYNS